MQITTRVIDGIAFAQRIQAIALARMHLPRHDQGVGDGADGVDSGCRVTPPQAELVVQKSDVERRVVDDQLGTPTIGEKILDNVAEARLVGKELLGDAMHLHGPCVDLAVRLQIAMEVAMGQTTLHQLDATNLDNAMALRGLQARGLGVEYDLTHTGCSGLSVRG